MEKENVIGQEMQKKESILECKDLVLKNDIKMPPRTKIRQELKKVSNFTDEEISIMWWSSLYKAYSLIVRYELTGVEDAFRQEEWFQNALKKENKEKSSEKSGVFDFTKLAKQSKKIEVVDETKILLKQKQKESKKVIKELKEIDKTQAKELKKTLKLQKRKFKSGEITLDNFFEFINNILNMSNRTLQPVSIATK
ncbi:MAG TPA: hypothetical protein PLM75_01770 [bacterium]|nr:hypothetical protein [bacterium]